MYVWRKRVNFNLDAALNVCKIANLKTCTKTLFFSFFLSLIVARAPVVSVVATPRQTHTRENELFFILSYFYE
jgi:hypothetical protein